jgi:hypothetical protein
MLHSRVKLILDYVKAVEKGEVPVCHETLRLAYSLCHRLPIMQPNRFKPDFYEVRFLINGMAVSQCIPEVCGNNIFIPINLLTAMQRCQLDYIFGNDYKRLRRSSSVHSTFQSSSWEAGDAQNSGSLLLIIYLLILSLICPLWNNH